jgi:hypothetical protein
MNALVNCPSAIAYTRHVSMSMSLNPARISFAL